MAQKNTLITNIIHEFAIFYEDRAQELTSLKQQQLWTVKDTTLHHRIVTILRLKKGDTCIVFNKTITIRFIVEDNNKKNLLLSYKEEIIPLKKSYPPICIAIPLLKRDALETTIYNVVELGVHQIIFIHTQHSRTQWSVTHESERLERLIISAMEQAKHFNWPLYNTTILSMASYLTAIRKNTPHFYADPQGHSLQHILTKTKGTDHALLTLLIGPEAGLTNEEQRLLQSVGYIPVALTNGILRAQQAATIFSGIFCSWYANR